MSKSKELIIFVPGIGVSEPEENLEKLITGIRSFCDGQGLKLRTVDDRGELGTGHRCLELELADGSSKTIDIQEVYWGDLRPLLSTESIMRKVLRGITLLVFWISSLETWKRVSSSKYMMFNMIFTLILILTWYYGALAAGLTVVGSNPGIFGDALPKYVVDGIRDLGVNMGSWYVWSIAAVIMGVLPVTEVIDISYASKAYLQNRHGMRHKVCGRIAKALSDTSRSRDGGYDRITLLAHSFGVVVGTEVLADYTAKNAPNVRAITLGGPLLLIGARSARVQQAMDRLIANEKVQSWIDFYSDHDWLCTKSPIDEHSGKFESCKITATVPFDEKVSGQSHSLYFDDWDVIGALLH